jgi:opacity protein-like surface antigen
MKQIALVGAVALSLAVPSLAEAGEMSGEGIYGEIRGGVNFANDSDLEASGGDFGEVEFDTGYVIELAGGYRHPDTGIRGELALGFRGNDIDDLVVGGESASAEGLGVDGEADVVSGMVNLYFEPDLGGQVRPYVGGGIGAAYVSTDLKLSDEGESLKFVDDSDTVFAYQFMAGGIWEFSNNPKVGVTLGYTYFGTSDAEFKIDGSVPLIGGAPFDASYDSHAVMIGFRGTI